jgi:transcriptional regulator with XRE-family HTH domain
MLILGDAELQRQLGMRIRAIRDDYGIRQGELAIRAKITRPHLSQIENGEGGAAKINTLYAVAKGLGITLAQLLTDVGEH